MTVSKRVHAKVVWWDDAKGYGLLSVKGIPSKIFAHHSALPDTGFKTLTEGQRVTCRVIEAQRGLQAVSLRKWGLKSKSI